jgi:hypothetical protein
MWPHWHVHGAWELDLELLNAALCQLAEAGQTQQSGWCPSWIWDHKLVHCHMKHLMLNLNCYPTHVVMIGQMLVVLGHCSQSVHVSHQSCTCHIHLQRLCNLLTICSVINQLKGTTDQTSTAQTSGPHTCSSAYKASSLHFYIVLSTRKSSVLRCFFSIGLWCYHCNSSLILIHTLHVFGCEKYWVLNSSLLSKIQKRCLSIVTDLSI